MTCMRRKRGQKRPHSSVYVYMSTVSNGLYTCTFNVHMHVHQKRTHAYTYILAQKCSRLTQKSLTQKFSIGLQDDLEIPDLFQVRIEVCVHFLNSDLYTETLAVNRFNVETVGRMLTHNEESSTGCGGRVITSQHRILIAYRQWRHLQHTKHNRTTRQSYFHLQWLMIEQREQTQVIYKLYTVYIPNLSATISHNLFPIQNVYI